MVIDEYGNRRFYGLYRGVVADNSDPLGQGRLKLRVPQVLFDQITDWAWIRNSSGRVDEPPAVGHGVWVLFEGGDPSFPVAIGTFGKEIEKFPAFNVSQFITYDETTGTFGGSDAVPTGGAPGQVLTKAGVADYETTWTTPSPGASFTSVVKHEVVAAEALTIGQAVYVSSANGTNMVVSKASNATEGTSSKTMGLIAQSLPLNGKGYVITEGLLAGLNTGSAIDGDAVWLGVDGALIYGLTNKPIAPAHLVFIGVVTRAQNNNGEIFVRPQNGFELNEIHDALIASPTANQLFARNSANTLWENKSATSLGLVTTSDTGSVTNTMLAGSIDNAKLTNSSVTVNGSSVALGSSILVTATPTAGTVKDVSIIGTGLSPSVITGTAVIDTDSRLSDKRTPVDGSVITTSIADSNVTYAKIQNVSAQHRVLGRTNSGAGVVEELTPDNLITALNQASTAHGVASGGTGATSFTSGAYLKGAGTAAITAQSGIPAGDITSGNLAIARGGTGFTVGTGFVPVTPTSIAGATGSISSTGRVSITSGTGFFLNGIFTSSFRNYKIIIDHRNMGGAYEYARFCYSDNNHTTGGAYYGGGFYRQGGSTGIWQNTGDGYSYASIGYTADGGYTMIDVMSPQWNGSYGKMLVFNSYGAGSHTQVWSDWMWNGWDAFSGIYIYNGGANYSAEVEVYGYNH